MPQMPNYCLSISANNPQAELQSLHTDFSRQHEK